MPHQHEQSDISWMRRAIDLAIRGRGAVEPNPMVGCVIVKDGRIIGEGYHERFGDPHAEVNAIRSCTESPEGATAYVTLEPCCHTDKKTPPCVPALVEAKLARVVIGCLDPNARVNGQGVAQLRAAGIEVTSGLLEPEAKQLNAAFFARIRHSRPYVTLKWAQTADGKVAGTGGARLQISNRRSMNEVHELRSRCDAILVGINTVLSDDPLLIARHVPASRPLLRYVLDRNVRIPLQSRLVQTAREVPLILGVGVDAIIDHRTKLDELERLGVRWFPSPWLGRTMVDLFTRRVTHLLVEPGPTLAAAFFDDGSADRLWVIRSLRSLDEPQALDAPIVPDHFIPVGEADLDGDRLTEYLNPASPVFFAAAASADFRLAGTDCGGTAGA